MLKTIKYVYKVSTCLNKVTTCLYKVTTCLYKVTTCRKVLYYFIHLNSVMFSFLAYEIVKSNIFCITIVLSI